RLGASPLSRTDSSPTKSAELQSGPSSPYGRAAWPGRPVHLQFLLVIPAHPFVPHPNLFEHALRGVVGRIDHPNDPRQPKPIPPVFQASPGRLRRVTSVPDAGEEMIANLDVRAIIEVLQATGADHLRGRAFDHGPHAEPVPVLVLDPAFQDRLSFFHR